MHNWSPRIPVDSGPSTSIDDEAAERVEEVLAGPGLYLDLGTVTVRVRSSLRSFADHVRLLYGAFPFQRTADFSDIHVDLRLPRSLRRLLRPQATFSVDETFPFDAFPADSAFPLFEWGVNWCLSMRLNQHLLLHAGVVEHRGHAIILAALPGSGKSTLTAALMLNGFRLLSDEFCVVRLDTGTVQALL